MYEKKLFAGWGDMDFNAYMKATQAGVPAGEPGRGFAGYGKNGRLYRVVHEAEGPAPKVNVRDFLASAKLTHIRITRRVEERGAFHHQPSIAHGGNAGAPF